MQGQFVDLYASADYLGPGAIEIDRYQTEIFDIVRRRVRLGKGSSKCLLPGIRHGSLKRRRSTRRRRRRHLSIPRNIAPTVGSPTRVELAVPLKALVSQINYNLFDWKVTAQQSQSPTYKRRIWPIRLTDCCARMMSRCGTAPTRR